MWLTSQAFLSPPDLPLSRLAWLSTPAHHPNRAALALPKAEEAVLSGLCLFGLWADHGLEVKGSQHWAG